jgi:hypothetical protein
MLQRALHTGYQKTLAAGPVIAVCYGVNLLLAGPVALALYSVLRGAFGASMAAQTLNDGFDYTVVFDLIHFHGKDVLGLLSVLPWSVPAGLFVNTTLSGGILQFAATDNGGPVLPCFFRGCTRHAVRFLGLLGAIAILLIPLLLILIKGFAVLAGSVVPGAATENVIPILLAGFTASVVLVAFAAGIVMDYARVILVLDKNRGIARSVTAALHFVARNVGRVTALQAFLVFLWGCTITAALLVEVVRPEGRAMVLVAALLVHQLFVAARQGLRVQLFSSQLFLYRGLNPQTGKPAPELEILHPGSGL